MKGCTSPCLAPVSQGSADPRLSSDPVPQQKADASDDQGAQNLLPHYFSKQRGNQARHPCLLFTCVLIIDVVPDMITDTPFRPM